MKEAYADMWDWIYGVSGVLGICALVFAAWIAGAALAVWCFK